MHEGEWLETDGLGGFAMGTANGIPSRKYHSILTAPTLPPCGRTTLVNQIETWVTVDGVGYPLSSFLYCPDVIYPTGHKLLINFSTNPWPTWTYSLPGGGEIVSELLMSHGSSVTILRWTVNGVSKKTTLNARPLLSCREYHSLQRENPQFSFFSRLVKDRIYWQPYQNGPEIVALSNGKFEESPLWNKNFLYREEELRGYDCIEDLASPGHFTFDLKREEAVLILGHAHRSEKAFLPRESARESSSRLIAQERSRRRAFASSFHRAGDAFLVSRGKGLTIMAGYPWFTDWGRDTFIAVRGLCIATGRLTEAASILGQWTRALSRGMMPNRFLDEGGEPDYNSVDASLWFIVATYELLVACKATKEKLSSDIEGELLAAIEIILQSYGQGTRYDIYCDSDGLLTAGEQGVQLTWMDAKIGDYVVTPRIGKPVEIQALWINALKIGSLLLNNSSKRWSALYERATESFATRFWNEERGCLYDVVDVDHKLGALDSRIRPNQIFAVGGLPFSIIDNERGARVVALVEKSLLTPRGLRSLADGERGYAPRYEGPTPKRDFAYHQGTVWAWLMGAFVEAWIRVNGDNLEARTTARKKFIDPFLKELSPASGGHIPEIADAEFPFTWRGAPFQAWSIGELLRVTLKVL